MGIGRILLFGLAGMATILYAIITLNFPTFSYKYKMTLEFSTPSGLVVASNVSEVRISFPVFNYLFAQMPYQRDHIGDAMFINLGKGKNSIAICGKSGSLYKTNTWQNMPYYSGLFKISLNSLRITQEIESARRAGVLNVPFDQLPMIISFGRVEDPDTIIQVDPMNPAEVLGRGYSISKATIELTDEPITRGVIEKRLPWLRAMPENERVSVRYSFFAFNFNSEE